MTKKTELANELAELEQEAAPVIERPMMNMSRLPGVMSGVFRLMGRVIERIEEMESRDAES